MAKMSPTIPAQTIETGYTDYPIIIFMAAMILGFGWLTYETFEAGKYECKCAHKETQYTIQPITRRVLETTVTVCDSLVLKK